MKPTWSAELSSRCFLFHLLWSWESARCMGHRPQVGAASLETQGNETCASRCMVCSWQVLKHLQNGFPLSQSWSGDFRGFVCFVSSTESMPRREIEGLCFISFLPADTRSCTARPEGAHRTCSQARHSWGHGVIHFLVLYSVCTPCCEHGKILLLEAQRTFEQLCVQQYILQPPSCVMRLQKAQSSVVNPAGLHAQH